MKAPGARRAGLGLPVAVLVTALACGPGAIRRGAPARDDIVVIVVDTLRADHLGAWGYPHPTSPNLDRLAEGGVRWQGFYTNAAWTRPAMATLHTGLYARSVGVYEERFDVLPADVTTLAERLDAAGYLTLGLTANPNVNAWFGFDQGFREYLDSEVVFDWVMPRAEGQRGFEPGGTPMPSAREITERALALVDAHASELAGSPLYLQVLYVDPHFPYEPPAAHLEAVGARDDRVGRYDGEIHFTDAEIGRLLEGLEARGLGERAFVVVTSDHGEGLEDHPELPRGSGHGDHLYPSVLHIPLIVSHPSLPVGRVVHQMASLVDLAPTLLEVAGLPWDRDALPGRSLLAELRGEEAGPGPQRVFSETEWRYTEKLSVVTPSHQYLRHDDCAAFQRDGTHEGRELDPGARQMLTLVQPEELLGPTPEPGLRDELRGALAGWEAQTPRRLPLRRDPEDVVTHGDGRVAPAPGAGGAAPELTPELRRQLEALGYLDADRP